METTQFHIKRSSSVLPLLCSRQPSLCAGAASGGQPFRECARPANYTVFATAVCWSDIASSQLNRDRNLQRFCRRVTVSAYPNCVDTF